MSRVQRISLASALLLIAVLALVVVATQIAVTRYIAPGQSGFATTEVVLFEPAVVGAVVSAIVVVVLLGHVVLVARRSVSRSMWIAAVGVSAVAVVAAVMVSVADTPVF